MAAPVALTGSGNVTTATVTASATLTASKPANVADGDLLWAVASSRNSAGTWDTVPTGWTLAAGQSTSGTFGIWTKPIPSASAETDTTYTWHTTGGSARGIIAVGRITGANLNGPVDATGTAVTSGTSSIVGPAVTAVHVDTLLLAVFASYLATSTQPIITAPAAMTEVAGVAVSTGAATSYLEVAAQQLSATGSTGSRTAAVSPAGTSAAGLMVTIASIPAGAASLSSVSSVTASATTSGAVGASLASASALQATAHSTLNAAASLTSLSSLSASAGVGVVNGFSSTGVWQPALTYELVGGSWVQS